MSLRQLCLDNNLPIHRKYRFSSAKASTIAECRGKFRKLYIGELGRLPGLGLCEAYIKHHLSALFE